MSAITSAAGAGFEQGHVRLWSGSAFAVLLAHLAIAALLFLHIELKQPVLRGTADALDVELAPPSALPASSAARSTVPQLPQEQQPVRPRPQPQVAAVSAIKPLPQLQLQPIPQPTEEPQPPSVTPADIAASAAAAATASVLAAPDLTVFTATLGQLNAPLSPEQAWLAQVIAQLQRYKSYPRSAVKRRQEDTVTLQFTVNRAGQVVSSKISSKLHYKVLENEARKMLRLATPLPTLPRQLTAGQIIVHIPVDFYLIARKPALASCVKPADPGPAPAGTATTLKQMRAYRQRLSQYVGAAGNYINCVGRGTDTASLASRSAAVNQVHALVDRFNAQAQAFKAQAAAQAQQAAAARLAQAQAEAARAYADCTAPAALRPAGADLAADAARLYRKQLLGYEAAVRVYLGCIHQAQLASAIQTGSTLSAARRALLDRTAVQLANAAVLPFDQLLVGFNAQARRLQNLQTRALVAGARKSAIPGEQVRAPEVFFPDSIWDTVAPLPAGNCFSIVRVGRTYQAQLCKSTYVTDIMVHGYADEKMAVGDTKANGDPFGVPNNHSFDPRIAAIGTQTAPAHDIAGRARAAVAAVFAHPQATHYTISELQVTGDHVALAINRKSEAASGSEKNNWSAVHVDLALSADNQSLTGYCWTEQKRWNCQLPRHH